jgi:hypothetical protein
MTHLMKPAVAGALLVLLAWGLPGQAQTFPSSYTVTELQPLSAGKDIVPVRMSNLGQVVGSATVTISSKTTWAFLAMAFHKVVTDVTRQAAVVWNKGTPTKLAPLSGTNNAWAADINDAGDVIGAADLLPPSTSALPTLAEANGKHAVIWRGGKITDLHAGNYTLGVQINKLGWAMTKGGPYLKTAKVPAGPAPAILINGVSETVASHVPAGAGTCDKLTDVGTLLCTANDYLPDGTFSASRYKQLSWVDRRVQDVAYPGALHFEVNASSRSGVLAGSFSLVGERGANHVYRYQNGQFTLLPNDLPDPDWSNSVVVAVNGKGEALGQWSHSTLFQTDPAAQGGQFISDLTHFGVWTASGFIDLGARIQLKPTEQISKLIDINDKGQVLAALEFYTPPTSTNRWGTVIPSRYVVLTPN